MPPGCFTSRTYAKHDLQMPATWRPEEDAETESLSLTNVLRCVPTCWSFHTALLCAICGLQALLMNCLAYAQKSA